MRLSLRLNLALIAGVALVSVALALYQTEAARYSLRRELENRALLLAESIERSAAPSVESHSVRELQALANYFRDRQHLTGVAIYNQQGSPLAVTPGLPPHRIHGLGYPKGEFFRDGNQAMHVIAVPVTVNNARVGTLAVFQDASYIGAQTTDMWRHALAGVVLQTLLIVCITLLILHWSLRRPLTRLAHWLRQVRAGEVPEGPELPEEEAFQPLKREVAHLANILSSARAAAMEEARLRHAAESLWTPERLRVLVKDKLSGSRLFVISNREPFEHSYSGGQIEWSVPASGLVTALSPILRACNGTWIAQGTGDADRATVDDHDRLPVPPDDPQYTLRRVWLSAEEEQGFYIGFANEGLWPLCHIAHTRPVFRPQDWEEYCRVNRRFADVLLEEIADEKDPVVLVQDYHFALVPKMVKEARPDARTIIFWHIPWPNPEAFSICPWQRELLDGLLGADLIGFHIQFHCNNFLDTVDGALESRVDREHFAVNRRGHLTCVRPFPISVDFMSGQDTRLDESPYIERADLFRGLGIEATMLGIGVDRVDYTKGIPERFAGIETLFDKYPLLKRQFTFVQIGAPSRTTVRRYRDLLEEVSAEAERINRRFETGGWKPIVFIPRHHSHEQIQPYYRAADVCVVTSLHDGMNLVAKEYVAARSDGGGVLILSRFAGASHELVDALVINPYDPEELADAIQRALDMSIEEKRARMARMRAYVGEHNIYRWAADLITALAALRLDMPEDEHLAEQSPDSSRRGPGELKKHTSAGR